MASIAAVMEGIERWGSHDNGQLDGATLGIQDGVCRKPVGTQFNLYPRPTPEVQMVKDRRFDRSVILPSTLDAARWLNSRRENVATLIWDHAYSIFSP